MARYHELRQTLAMEIAAGRPPVGSRFATDQELCRRFGVSRHTVREALRDLQDGGLLIRQRGSGTVVAAATPAPKIYSQTFQSLDQLDAYAKDVRFEKRSETVVVLQRKLAELLDCPLNSKWLHIVGLRWLVESSHPLGWSEIFIAEPFIGVRDQTSDGFMAYYEKLRRAFGLAAKRVDLRVSAVGVPRKVASALGVKAGTPALLVRRQYFADGDVPFEVSLTVHPGDRYVHTARIARENVNMDYSA